MNLEMPGFKAVSSYIIKPIPPVIIMVIRQYHRLRKVAAGYRPVFTRVRKEDLL